jgi:hemerythrin-like domain-containing protein
MNVDFRRQTNRKLDDEHRSALSLYGSLEQALVTRDADALARLCSLFARHLAEDIGHHFDFEERELFPRLAAAGEGDIAELLAEEHAAIRDVASILLPLARIGAAALDARQSDTFRRCALELVERQVAHIQKESMALLPMLEELLDEDVDRELSFAYSTG